MKYWPRVQDIAELAGVSRATVDRVLHGRSSVRKETAKLVFGALEELKQQGTGYSKLEKLRLDLAFVVHSGPVFKERLSKMIDEIAPKYKKYGVSVSKFMISNPSPTVIGKEILNAGYDRDGVMVVSPQDPFISDVVNRLADRNVPVVCVTSELPNTRCLGCVQMDQLKAGHTAGTLIGRFIGPRRGGVVLVVGGKFRSQQEREMGFRQVIRDDFPLLNITEIIHTEDRNESSYAAMRAFLSAGDRPLAVYNVTGGIRGITDAIAEFPDPANPIIYVCHELTTASRELLVHGKIDALLDHDVDREISSAVEHLINYRVPGTFDVDFHPYPVHIYLSTNLP